MKQEEVLDIIEDAFRDAKRPEHFTNYLHCEDCADHDNLLRTRDRATIKVEDVSNPAWNPIDYLTPEGFLYYFPALAKLALSEAGEEFLTVFVPFHLHKALVEEETQQRDLLFLALSEKQCKAILSFVRFAASKEKKNGLTYDVNQDEFDSAVSFWENECSSK